MNEANATRESMTGMEKNAARMLTMALDLADDADLWRRLNANQDARGHICRMRAAMESMVLNAILIMKEVRRMINTIPVEARGDVIAACNRAEASLRQATALMVSSYLDCS